MRGKETIDVMLGIIDSLQAVIPELSLDTNSEWGGGGDELIGKTVLCCLFQSSL